MMGPRGTHGRQGTQAYGHMPTLGPSPICQVATSHRWKCPWGPQLPSWPCLHPQHKAPCEFACQPCPCLATCKLDANAIASPSFGISQASCHAKASPKLTWWWRWMCLLPPLGVVGGCKRHPSMETTHSKECVGGKPQASCPWVGLPP